MVGYTTGAPRPKSAGERDGGLGREMNLRFSVEEMIKMFGATYRTIDIRCAAVKQGDA
jgi:hypothetical protein